GKCWSRTSAPACCARSKKRCWRPRKKPNRLRPRQRRPNRKRPPRKPPKLQHLLTRSPKTSFTAAAAPPLRLLPIDSLGDFVDHVLAAVLAAEETIGRLGPFSDKPLGLRIVLQDRAAD